MLISKRNRTCFYTICLLCVISLLLQFGCERNDGSTDASIRRMKYQDKKAEKEFEAELKATMEKTELMFKPYRDNGLVKVTLNPADGEIYIDDGLVTIPKKGLMLPVGKYEIKAVWQDGKYVTKKVFVTPALQELISYNWDFKRNTNGGSGNQKSNIKINAPLSPTEVALVKPM